MKHLDKPAYPAVNPSPTQMVAPMISSSGYADRYTLIDRCCHNGDFTRALELAESLLAEDSHDRTARLYALLIDIVLRGPLAYEAEIDYLRTYGDLTDRERNLIRKILRVCHDTEINDGNHLKALSYERLLRRLLINQSIDISMPTAESNPTPDNGAELRSNRIRSPGDRAPSRLKNFVTALIRKVRRQKGSLEPVRSTEQEPDAWSI